MSAPADNAPRFRVGTDHVESWFFRANDPGSPRALWLKATVLTKADGTALSQAWCSVFDGDRTEGFRLDVPLAEATFAEGSDDLDVSVGTLALRLGRDGGTSSGELGRADGGVTWNVGFDRHPGPLGRPMSLLPSRRLVDGPFPKNKLLTPFPVVLCRGTVTWHRQTWDLGGWVGMQGHNWGASHSPEYAWGQCVFTDATGTPSAVVEGASGRIEIGSRLSPLLSMLVLRREDQEYRFDRIVDLWRQHPNLDFPRWSLRMTGSPGEAHLEMRGRTAAMVCLGYQNPARPTSYCLNSKTADVTLTLAPRRGERVDLHSGHGGALEFLMPRPVEQVQPVV